MNNYRQIVSIALLITSAVLILTGGLILLHLDSRTVMHLHKYFGMAFMCAALLHMGINSKPLRHYLSMRSLVVPLLVAAVLLGAAVRLVAAVLLVAAIAAWDMTRPHGYGRYARDTTFFCR